MWRTPRCASLSGGQSFGGMLTLIAHAPPQLNAQGDNDPVDVVEIGSAVLPSGSVTPVSPSLPSRVVW
jgi:inorganic pyrophosphatase